MSALKLIGLIAALMISAALACSAAMVMSGAFTGMGSPSLTDALTFGAEALAFLGLSIWLSHKLRASRVRQQ